MEEERLIHLLDHGFVRLVDSMGDDLSIIRAARVSHNADWRAGEDTGSDARLINYLWTHQHTSPFEAVTLTFEVKAPIFVFRQWHRHRTQSYNEVSARYTELPGEYYTPQPQHIGSQSTLTKQARDMIREHMSKDFVEVEDQITGYRATCEAAIIRYQRLLGYGWPRELARMCLPVSTYSRMFTTLNLLNLFRFLRLRMDQHTQYEIRVYADALYHLAHRVAPCAATAFYRPVIGSAPSENKS